MKKIHLISALVALFGTTQWCAAQSKATFYTNNGNFVVDLYDTMQPITTNNFKTLVNAKFYDGVIFHRVINGFMIQGGDPTGTGAGGPGYTIMDEFDAAASNIQKSIAMANSGPNTGGSQFFINLVNNTYLNPNHPVFGIVSSNFSVVQTIGAVATNASDRPLVDVVMDSIRITSWPTSVSTVGAESNRLLFEVYPNPATANSLVSVQSPKSQLLEMSVCDMYGKEYFRQGVQMQAGINSFTLSDLQIADVSAGIYVIIIKDQHYVYSNRMVISN
jgi:cyclophilin family peptidyl-prolyl cis-trans isomerase